MLRLRLLIILMMRNDLKLPSPLLFCLENVCLEKLVPSPAYLCKKDNWHEVYLTQSQNRISSLAPPLIRWYVQSKQQKTAKAMKMVKAVTVERRIKCGIWLQLRCHNIKSSKKWYRVRSCNKNFSFTMFMYYD